MSAIKKYLCKKLNCCEHIEPSEEEIIDSTPKPPHDDFELYDDPHKFSISPQGVQFIQQWEGFSAKPYWDKTGKVWTIGYGNTGKGINKYTKPVTRARATQLLMAHIRLVEADVRSLVKVHITQHQFDALVSFAYNVGTDIDDDNVAEGLGDSTLLKLLNANQVTAAADEFPKWRFSGGVEMRGLLNRRLAERKMFLSYREQGIPEARMI